MDKKKTGLSKNNFNDQASNIPLKSSELLKRELELKGLTELKKTYRKK